MFPGLNVRLGSLGATRLIIEAQLERARAAEIDRQRQEHRSLGPELHPEDREADEFDLQQQVMHLLPKALRGGFLITLWAVLERTTHDIASVAMAHRGRALDERAFHKPFFVAAADALVKAVGIQAFPDAGVEQKLRLLQAVRHALVHHDGRQAELPAPYTFMSAAELERMGFYLVRDYDYAYVIPAENYIKEATDLVYNYVHSTADRVFNALVPNDA
jgi:hypothetical protein